MFGTIVRLATKAVPVLGTVVTVASVIVEVAAIVHKIKKRK
jgi:hypothetical protein